MAKAKKKATTRRVPSRYKTCEPAALARVLDSGASIDEAAEHLGVSRRTVERVAAAQLGASPGKYITRVEPKVKAPQPKKPAEPCISFRLAAEDQRRLYAAAAAAGCSAGQWARDLVLCELQALDERRDEED